MNAAPCSSTCGPSSENGSRWYPPINAAMAASNDCAWRTGMLMILSVFAGQEGRDRQDWLNRPDGLTRQERPSSLSCPCRPPALFLDRRLLDVVELRELRLQIGVSLRLDAALVRLLAVLVGDLLDDVHSGAH